MNCETMPRHIWMESVIAGVSAKGLSTGSLLAKGALRMRLNQAYAAGEPVWMAASEMVLRLQQTARVERSWETDMARAIRRGRRAG